MAKLKLKIRIPLMSNQPQLLPPPPVILTWRQHCLPTTTRDLWKCVQVFGVARMTQGRGATGINTQGPVVC